jgi:hypothetical protein
MDANFGITSNASIAISACSLDAIPPFFTTFGGFELALPKC